MNSIKVFLVAGARPNFMKIAPMMRALRAKNQELGAEGLTSKIVHTGQHYDYEMSQAFFEDLHLPRPDFFLNAGSGTQAEQTGKIMTAFEKVCLEEKPDLVVVVGDVNSTLACTITAKKLQLRVAHVEAGLRSFDMAMPEEINRIVTDSISDTFFVTEKSGVDNLLKEGKPQDRIFFVGHVMIDNLLYQLEILDRTEPDTFAVNALKERLGRYLFLTLHRPSNVDSKERLQELAETLDHISAEIPILFPAHPRTRKMLDTFHIKLGKAIHVIQPLGFMEALFAWKDAEAVMTDSGGLQAETTALGVPCLTLRENTEQPVTVELGTNRLVGNRRQGILEGLSEVLANGSVGAVIPPMWDGKAAERIVDVLATIAARGEGGPKCAGKNRREAAGVSPARDRE